MKRNILSAVLTLYCLLPIAAQPLSKADSLQIEIAQLENALTSIQTDLQEKTLQYNWEITEKYIEYCKKLYKITNFNREPRLIQLATTIKPEELEPQRLAYEKAKKELSATTSYDINLPYITVDATGPKNLMMSISRAKFEELISDLVQRSIEPCKKVLKDA